MNQAIENILTRRSIRSFEVRAIPREDVELLLRAALCAPSGKGLQTWQFTAVLNREKIQRLAAVVGEKLGRTGYDMYAPEMVIIPSNERDSAFGREDDACALENIFLAAHALGIGSVWINQLQGICDEPEIRAVLRELGIPDDHVVYGLAALGYPAGERPGEKVRTGKTLIVE